MKNKYVLDNYKWVIDSSIDINFLKGFLKAKMQPHKCIKVPLDEEYQQAIEEMECIIRRTLPTFNLNTFYNNILDLIFEKKCGKKTRCTATYFFKENKIIVYFKAFSKFHELLHVATSPDDERSGFYCKGVGVGINEGYTTFLDNIYFSKNIKGNSNLYNLFSKYALLVDLLIGREKMILYYSNASLYDLIIELCNYMEERHVKMFINALDDIYANYSKGVQTFTKKSIQANIDYCTSFVIQALDKKYYGTKDYVYVMNLAFKLLKDDVVLKGNKYKILDMNEELIKKIINNMNVANKILKKR